MNHAPILKKENIIHNCPSVSKKQAILDVGQMLVEQGYVTPNYIEGMIRRDRDVSVYIGNMLAIPHGDFDVKDAILQSGLVVRIYPDGIDWDGNIVKIVIGIAAIGDEHLKVLSNCALAFEELETVEQVVNSSDVNWIHTLLVKGI